MYEIIETTDKKYIGVILLNITNPINIDNKFIFNYTYRKELNDNLIIANSNYVINLIKIN